MAKQEALKSRTGKSPQLRDCASGLRSSNMSQRPEFESHQASFSLSGQSAYLSPCCNKLALPFNGTAVHTEDAVDGT